MNAQELSRYMARFSLTTDFISNVLIVSINKDYTFIGKANISK